MTGNLRTRSIRTPPATPSNRNGATPAADTSATCNALASSTRIAVSGIAKDVN
jgi:hypothetical protein